MKKPLLITLLIAALAVAAFVGLRYAGDSFASFKPAPGCAVHGAARASGKSGVHLRPIEALYGLAESPRRSSKKP